MDHYSMIETGFTTYNITRNVPDLPPKYLELYRKACSENNFSSVCEERQIFINKSLTYKIFPWGNRGYWSSCRIKAYHFCADGPRWWLGCAYLYNKYYTDCPGTAAVKVGFTQTKYFLLIVLLLVNAYILR